jgi:diguanylate cyclase (GGDEF)-like protein
MLVWLLPSAAAAQNILVSSAGATAAGGFFGWHLTMLAGVFLALALLARRALAAARDRPSRDCESSEDPLQIAKSNLELLVAENNAGVLVLDANGTILFGNPSAARLLGIAPERLLGAPFGIPLAPDVHTEIEIAGERGEGGIAQLIVSESAWLKEKAYLALLFDITERKASEQRMQELAFADPLTQLPNRNLFLNRLSHTLRLAQRQRQGFAVVFMDIDRFKLINDTFGHAFGDMLLCEVADRLKGALRASDTVARLGGDEFTAIVYGVDTEEAANVVGAKLRAAMREPMWIEDEEFYINVSIGVALYPLHSENPDALLRYADSAMYDAKRNSEAGLRVYAEGLSVVKMGRMRLRGDQRSA